MYKAGNMIIGIDEAGRGPLAGPVFVGVVKISQNKLSILDGIRDSKALSPEKREAWLKTFMRQSDDTLSFSYAYTTPKHIDTVGIVPAVDKALSRALTRIAPELDDSILLDGGLSAPTRFTRQKTIIRGDQTEPAIAAASIVAKVMRDRMMVRYAQRFPYYGFDQHKGYGTKAHKIAIRKYGLSPIHRMTFVTR